MEIFKESAKSICHNCDNIELKCSGKIMITCGTDPKISKAFVQNCNKFNTDLYAKNETKTRTLSVQARRETRVEMMGGGHADPEK